MHPPQEGVSSEAGIECILEPTADKQSTAMFLPKGMVSNCGADQSVQVRARAWRVGGTCLVFVKGGGGDVLIVHERRVNCTC